MSDEQKNITAYSLYSVQAKQRTKVNPLEDIYPKLPDKKYQVIYADPPWDYGGKMQYDKTTIKDVKNYKPENNSISTGQVLHTPYDYNKTKLIIKEMIDSLSLDLVAKGKITNPAFLGYMDKMVREKLLL